MSKRTVMMSGLVFLVLAAGCVGRYERDMQVAASQAAQARYEAQAQAAQAQAAQAQAQAQAVEAQARADAQIGVAQANSRAAIVREEEKTERQTAWLGVLPWLLAIVTAGGVAVAYWWLFLRARVQVEQVRVRALLPASPVMILPPERMIPSGVRRRAAATGTQPVPQGECWLLVDHGGEVVEVLERRQ